MTKATAVTFKMKMESLRVGVNNFQGCSGRHHRSYFHRAWNDTKCSRRRKVRKWGRKRVFKAGKSLVEGQKSPKRGARAQVEMGS